MSAGPDAAPSTEVDLPELRREIERLDDSGLARARLEQSRERSCPPVEELVVMEAGRVRDTVGSASLWLHLVTCNRCTRYLLDLRRVRGAGRERRRGVVTRRGWIWLLILAGMAAAGWWARQAGLL